MKKRNYPETIRVCAFHVKWSCNVCLENVYIYVDDEKTMSGISNLLFSNPVAING